MYHKVGFINSPNLSIYIYYAHTFDKIKFRTKMNKMLFQVKRRLEQLGKPLKVEIHICKGRMKPYKEAIPGFVEVCRSNEV